MRQELLYAFAAAGALAVGRWFVLFVIRCFAGTRRFRRLVLTRVVETITDPEWQDHVAEGTRTYVEDFGAAMDRARSAPAPPLRLTKP